MGLAETELHYRNPYELIVAVILSAQCTDKRVNMTTPAIFERFPEPAAMAAGSVEEIYQLIKSISYPNNKARHLYEMARKLVGRKTANVIMAGAFHRPAMPVDTHVFRVTNRIGLVNHTKTPLETEKQLVNNIPAEMLSTAHHWFILHGRYVCTARKPKCETCGIRTWCKFAEK